MVNFIQEHFEKAFSSEEVLDIVDTIITGEMNRKLLRLVIFEEVRKATLNLGSLKAPGLDGFLGIIFKKHWNVVGENVFYAAKEFFKSGIWPAFVNETHIALVLKIPKPEILVLHFRPISLCNFIYKIISKVIVNKLKVIMPSIILEEQGVFVSSRAIQDNLLVDQGAVLHLEKEGKKGFFVVKTDMIKAYDGMDWGFLEALLLRMGFDQVWVQRILVYVCSISYKILVNGCHKTVLPPKEA